MPPFLKNLTAAASMLLPALCNAASLEVTAVNPFETACSSQTIELSAADLAPLAEPDLSKIHVVDSKGADVLCQAIDNDGDPLRKFDAVIFQSDFAAGETRTFVVSSGTKQVFTKDQFKAFGRFNRERFDDFVWENDRIAHRTYGKALETWKGEPLTSSTIDIWSKRTPRMVVNDWYLADDYHKDHGEGADFYSAGLSRGCGGSGLWAADKLWVSKNFVNSKVLANGPIRVMFELEYEPYDLNGVNVSEIKRVTLDAGHYLNRYQSIYKTSKPLSLAPAIGLKKVGGERVMEASHWLVKWEPMEKKAGQQGLAIIVPKDEKPEKTEDSLNHLLVLEPRTENTATWWAGFCWDKAGAFTNAEDWIQYVNHSAGFLETPVKVSVAPGR